MIHDDDSTIMNQNIFFGINIVDMSKATSTVQDAQQDNHEGNHDSCSVSSISIIIPVLNQENHIIKCIKSIFKKAHQMKNIEVIVVDGHSKDGTTSLVVNLDERITGYTCKTTGRGSQMNHGASMATNDVLFFLHADSVVPDRFDQAILQFLNDNSTMKGGTFKSIVTDTKKINTKQSTSKISTQWFYRASDFYTNEWSSSPHGSSGLFVKRTHFIAHPFNDQTNMEIYDYFNYKLKPSQWRTLNHHMLVHDDRYRSGVTSALQYFYDSNVAKVKYSLFGH